MDCLNIELSKTKIIAKTVLNLNEKGMKNITKKLYSLSFNQIEQFDDINDKWFIFQNTISDKIKTSVVIDYRLIRLDSISF